MAEYKIKDLETLTGIKAHTLRIWEKRYNLLSPNRTETKIRTYSDKDLVKLLNVAILYDSGVKISKIAEFSSNQIQQKVTDLYDHKYSYSAVVSLLVQSMIVIDCETFERVLKNTIQKEGLETVYKNYLVSFLNRIGVLWMVGTITPVQEHFVSNLIRQTIIVETDKLPIVVKRRIDAVLFTPEGEFHEISLLFYNYILRKRNFRTLYLGANLPIVDLKSTLSTINPKNLIVSIIAGVSEESYSDFMKFLTDEVRLPVFLGGAMVDNYGLPKSEIIFPIQDWIE
ncbi:MerR family transcriptional regulator [Brumimicrobium mesophilum]|uniref:MerR family transcriptional regulator n=1 Tax=Brumimicrobium mesophilum TaxID=392717 RepID=UPI000D13FD61|nr:MerR family transcriptional regulator [Brumimicrobium mesophilum]